MFSVFFVIKNIVAIPVFLIWTIYTSRYDLPLQTLLLFLFYPSVLKHRPACTARAYLLIGNGLAYIHAFFAPKNTGREPEAAVPSSARLIIKYPDYLLLPLFYTSIYKNQRLRQQNAAVRKTTVLSFYEITARLFHMP